MRIGAEKMFEHICHVSHAFIADFKNKPTIFKSLN